MKTKWAFAAGLSLLTTGLLAVPLTPPAPTLHPLVCDATPTLKILPSVVSGTLGEGAFMNVWIQDNRPAGCGAADYYTSLIPTTPSGVPDGSWQLLTTNHIQLEGGKSAALNSTLQAGKDVDPGSYALGVRVLGPNAVKPTAIKFKVVLADRR